MYFPRAYDDVQYLPPVLAPFVLPARGALRDPAMADHVHAQREHYYHAVLLHEFDRPSDCDGVGHYGFVRAEL